jgi:thioredoxin 1
MKKILLFAGALIILFGGLFAIVKYKESQEEDLYYNQISLDELETKLANGEDVTVYFYSPECPHCRETTPMLVPLTEDLGVEMLKLNVDKYPEVWDKYIQGTPTLIHFEDGKKVDEEVGSKSKETYQDFFETNVLN